MARSYSPDSRKALKVTEGKAKKELSSLSKVAILMVALGQETASRIMKYLSEYEIEQITRTIAELRHITPETQSQVLEEFGQHILAGQYITEGGVDFARGMLERALGSEEAQKVLDRVFHTATSPFNQLQNINPEQLAPFLQNEHPQTIALILSQLTPNQAAGVLALLPEALQADVTHRVATMETISPEAVRQLEKSMETQLGEILGGTQEVGGAKAVANILNLTGYSTEKNVLEQLEAEDPELAEQVRNLMFTFDDIAKLTDQEIQAVLREVDQQDLVIALKAASSEVKDRVLGNMSERVRTYIWQEMDFTGPMRLSEVEEVQLRIMQQVRQLEEQGQIAISRGEGEDVFV